MYLYKTKQPNDAEAKIGKNWTSLYPEKIQLTIKIKINMKNLISLITRGLNNIKFKGENHRNNK